MALTSRATIAISNLANRGDAFARNILFKSSWRDQMLISNLAKRGDKMAQRHVLGDSAPVMAKALLNRMARAGEVIAQGLLSITLDKLAQVITFAQPATLDISVTGGVLALSATSDSSLPVTFVITDAGATGATLSGSTLTVTDPGDVVIEAQQAGTPNYAAATPVSRTITVVA